MGAAVNVGPFENVNAVKIKRFSHIRRWLFKSQTNHLHYFSPLWFVTPPALFYSIYLENSKAWISKVVVSPGISTHFETRKGWPRICSGFAHQLCHTHTEVREVVVGVFEDYWGSSRNSFCGWREEPSEVNQMLLKRKTVVVQHYDKIRFTILCWKLLSTSREECCSNYLSHTDTAPRCTPSIACYTLHWVPFWGKGRR